MEFGSRGFANVRREARRRDPRASVRGVTREPVVAHGTTRTHRARDACPRSRAPKLSIVTFASPELRRDDVRSSSGSSGRFDGSDTARPPSERLVGSLDLAAEPRTPPAAPAGCGSRTTDLRHASDTAACVVRHAPPRRALLTSPQARDRAPEIEREGSARRLGALAALSLFGARCAGRTRNS